MTVLGQPIVPRYLGIVLVVAMGVAASLLAFRLLDKLETSRHETAFQQESHRRVGLLLREIQAEIDTISSVQAFISASGPVSRAEFHTFVSAFLSRYPSLKALEWVPRVTAGERAAYEEAARRDGYPDFEFRRLTEGKLDVAELRDEYFPVYYVEPMAGNEQAFGFDLSSNAIRREALERARDTGALVVSGRITLVQEVESQFAVLLFLPVYETVTPADTVAARRDGLLGFALGVFRIGNAMATLDPHNSVREALDFYLIDVDGKPGQRLLYAPPQSAAMTTPNENALYSDLHHTHELTIGGRNWVVVVRPGPSHKVGWYWQPWAALVAVLLCTLLLAAYISSTQARTQVVAGMVEKRTAELNLANEQLRREVGEHRRTDMALRASDARMNSILANIDYGIALLDPDLRVRLVNEAFKDMWNVPDDFAKRSPGFLEMLELFRDTGIYDVPEDKWWDYVEKRHQMVLAADSVASESNRSDDRVLQYKCIPLPYDWRMLTYFDITERKKIENMKTEFVSTVSHELRTPLTSVQGSLRFIRSEIFGPMPEKAADMVEIAYNNCDRLVRLINDILDIEKIESGKLQYDLRPLRSKELIEFSVAANKGYTEKFGVGLRITGDPLDTIIVGDSDRLTQVLTNLISNAAKVSPAGDEVLVSATVLGDLCRISVADRGPGIPEDFQERMFEKFTQADSSDKRQVGGTGLGLNICRGIVKQHGGALGFKTAIGQGTTFYFDLPITRQSINELATSEVESEADPMGT